jgi:hypothetical protein
LKPARLPGTLPGVRGCASARCGALLRAGAAALLLAACQPKVQVEAPKEPITINLNVKIEHEIRIKVDKDLEDLFQKEEGIF